MQFLRSLTMITACYLFATTSITHASPASRIGYAIQAGAFKELRNAQRLAGRLNNMNLEAVNYKKENSLYAVTFGNFKTWAAAHNTAKRLQQEHIISTYYVAEPVKHTEVFRNMSASPTEIEHSDERGKIAARTAERFVGIPYHWGGNNVVEGLDCSGFVKAVYYLIGLDIRRTAREQYNEGATVSIQSIREGDLVFFGKNRRKVSHVGMYIGDNKFVHAPRRGEPIQITSLKDELYASRYVGARRYL